jgi:hypothetical protein
MAYIRTLANGNYRADVRMKGIVKNKTFLSQSLAQIWPNKIEHSIKKTYAPPPTKTAILHGVKFSRTFGR